MLIGLKILVHQLQLMSRECWRPSTCKHEQHTEALGNHSRPLTRTPSVSHTAPSPRVPGLQAPCLQLACWHRALAPPPPSSPQHAEQPAGGRGWGEAQCHHRRGGGGSQVAGQPAQLAPAKQSRLQCHHPDAQCTNNLCCAWPSKPWQCTIKCCCATVREPAAPASCQYPGMLAASSPRSP